MFIGLHGKQKSGDWATFALEEYDTPVTGFFHTKENPAENGMAFGTIDTGCIDIESDGTIGFMSIFNSLAPRRGPVNMPMFGISCGTSSFMLSTLRLKNYPEDSLNNNYAKRAAPAKDILYFGHYPMLDMEYILEDSPVEVSSRMYVPFFPGNAKESNTPGGIIEFYIRNKSDAEISGNLCMSFPGPSAEEVCGNLDFTHEISEYNGAKILTVKNSDNIGYSIGVSEIENGRFETGGCLGVDGFYWSHIGYSPNWHGGHEYRLPIAYNQPGGSVSSGYCVSAGQTVKIIFVLSWYAAIIQSGGAPISKTRGFTDARTGENCNKQYLHMYAKRFGDSLDVAKYLIDNADAIKKRIISWQSVIYKSKNIPGWLADSLINSLYVITEDSIWAQAKPPIGDWCREEDGIFGMNECPRGCPQIECIPCSFYGSLPIVYFFPELALSTLRTIKAYQFDDGAIPWVFGGITVNNAFWDLTSPRLGYQITTNGISYATMADRLIRYMNAENLKREFYESLKRNMIYTMELNPEPDGIISMPNRTVSEGWTYETEWFEVCAWDGMVSHVGGLHLAQLRIVERLAREVGDIEFEKRCADWIADGQKSMEEKLWTDNGNYYLNFYNEKTGNKSDYIFGYQLDGEWIARFHGLDSVFDPERVTKVLNTIEKHNVRLSKFGAANYVTPDGELAYAGGGLGVDYNANDFFPPELLMLAMTFMQDGKKEFGLELARRCMHEIICVQGKSFNSPNLIRGDKTQSTFGNDYYQMLMIWGLPAVIEGKSLEEYGEKGGFIVDIIEAAKI